MMADNLDILFRPSTALSLTVTMSRKEEVLAAFEVLEDGGEVIYPPHSTTYSSCTTNVIDRFGFRWVMTRAFVKGEFHPKDEIPPVNWNLISHVSLPFTRIS